MIVLALPALADCPPDPAALLAAARTSGDVDAYREACTCGSADACFELLVHRDRAAADTAFAATRLGGLCGGPGRPDCATLASGDTVADVERDCLAGQAARCGEASVRWRDGQGVTPDRPRAHAYARMACAGGYWFSCNDLTVLYDDPLGEQVSLAKFLDGCDRGRADDCYWAGARLQVGFGGLPKDEARATALLTRSCDDGYGTACHTLASPLLFAEPPDVDGWIRGMERACGGGSPDGCAELATPLADLKALCKEVQAYCALAERRAAGRWPVVPR